MWDKTKDNVKGRKDTRRTCETNPRTMLQTGKPPREDWRHSWIKSRMNISCRFRIILFKCFQSKLNLRFNLWDCGHTVNRIYLGRLQMRKVVTMAMSTKVNLSSRPLRLRRCRTCVRFRVILCKYRVIPQLITISTAPKNLSILRL